MINRNAILLKFFNKNDLHFFQVSTGVWLIFPAMASWTVIDAKRSRKTELSVTSVSLSKG
jgi:hypothetical protein